MDINLSTEEKKFIDEVRRFVEGNLPIHIAEKVKQERHLGREDYMNWQQVLGRRGWHAFTWPKIYGGPGWSLGQRYLFENICAELNCPIIQPFGPRMAGPVIYTFGTQAQQDRFLPGIRDSTVWWCQGYSEPQSGSDLASLSTRAEKRGNRYIVNGQKIWTTYAHYADWMFCLVRTSKEEKPQKGISFLLIDMKSPGIKVQPIRMLEGTHSFNAVFFDNVEVPVENRIGNEGEGWTYAKFLLEHERVDNAAVGVTRAALQRLRTIATNELHLGRPIIEDPAFLAKFSSLEAQLMSLEITGLRALSKVSAGSAPGPISSLLKIRGTELAQQISQLTAEAAGYFALPLQLEYVEGIPNAQPIGPEYAGPASSMYFWKRCMSIYGGTNEIQKNIIARQILGI